MRSATKPLVPWPFGCSALPSSRIEAGLLTTQKKETFIDTGLVECSRDNRRIHWHSFCRGLHTVQQVKLLLFSIHVLVGLTARASLCVDNGREGVCSVYLESRQNTRQ